MRFNIAQAGLAPYRTSGLTPSGDPQPQGICKHADAARSCRFLSRVDAPPGHRAGMVGAGLCPRYRAWRQGKPRQVLGRRRYRAARLARGRGFHKRIRPRSGRRRQTGDVAHRRRSGKRPQSLCPARPRQSRPKHVSDLEHSARAGARRGSSAPSDAWNGPAGQSRRVTRECAAPGRGSGQERSTAARLVLSAGRCRGPIGRGALGSGSRGSSLAGAGAFWSRPRACALRPTDPTPAVGAALPVPPPAQSRPVRGVPISASRRAGGR